MFNFIQIILWFLGVFLILLSVKEKNIKRIVVIVLIAVGILEIVSIFLTDTLVDYRFYTHMNLESIEHFGFLFIVQIVVLLLIYLVLLWLILRVSDLLKIVKKTYKIFIIINLLIIIYILTLPQGIIWNFYNIYKITNVTSQTFNEALKDVGIDPNKYVLPKQIQATAGKNIIVISIESLEQGYLSNNFHNITPHLKDLTHKWTYYNNMPVGTGAGWTAGSLYTHQVGIPAFFKSQGFLIEHKNANHVNEEGQGNDLFQNTSSTKLTGLGTVLKKAGYDYRYIMGYIEFAGVKDILNTYGFKTISEMNSIGKYEHKRYGMDDIDLFSEAKLQLDEVSKNKKPFALFMSTINSHFPNGVYDKRMEKYVSKKENSLEFTVASVDYLINDFIQYLKKKNLLQNTVVYIFPDHLLMGRGGDVHHKLSLSKRQLYVITNASSKDLHKDINDDIYQVDLPRMILDGANIKTNAKFLVDIVHPDNMLKFLNEKRVEIASLNSASVSRENFNHKIKIHLKNGKVKIKSGIHHLEFKINRDYMVKDFTFTPGMVLINKEDIYRQDIFKPIHYDIRDRLLHLTLVIEDGIIKLAYFGNRQKVGIFKQGNDIIFLQDDVSSIINSNKLFFKNKSERIREINGKIKKVGKEIFRLSNTKNYIGHNFQIDSNEQNNSLSIEALSNDPIIFLNKIHSENQHVLLKYSIDSTKNTLFQIFYKRKDSSLYNEGDSYSVRLTKGSNEIQLVLPANYINNGLRIDLVNTKGRYIIKEFSLHEVILYE